MKEVLKKIIGPVFIVLFFIFIFCYVRNLYNQGIEDVENISSYSKSIIGEAGIKEPDTLGVSIALYINDKLFFEGNNLKDFTQKISELEKQNRQARLSINLVNLDNGQVYNTINKTYGDFSYSLNKVLLLKKIKQAIISSDFTIKIDIRDYVYFDNKGFNNYLSKIKDDNTEKNFGNIVFNEKSNTYKLDVSKPYVTYVESQELNIKPIYGQINLEDGDISLKVGKKENKLFNYVKELNNLNKVISDTNYSITASAKGNEVNVFKVLRKHLAKTDISYSMSEDDIVKIKFKKGFLKKYISLNSTTNLLEFDNTSFELDYSFLKNINIKPKTPKLMEKGTLYSINGGTLDDNLPSDQDFSMISYDNGVSFQFDLLLNNLTEVFSDIINKKKDLVLSDHNNILNNQDKESNIRYSFEVSDGFVINKENNKTYNKYVNGIYNNGDYLLEDSIDYSNYDIKLNGIYVGGTLARNTCELRNKMELFCGNNNKNYIGTFEYYIGKDGGNLFLRNVHDKVYLYNNSDSLIKENGDFKVLDFDNDGVVMFSIDDISGLYSNFILDFKSFNQIQETGIYQGIPEGLIKYLKYNLEGNKIVYSFKSNNENQKLVIKGNKFSNNKYFYLLDFNFIKNESNEEVY